MATTTATQIQQLYVGLLGRAADQGGLNWWADQVTTGGKTLEDVRASFVTSTEYTTTYGAATTRADLVTSIYQNLFERTPSADEVKYWAETDTRPADQLVAAFIEFAGAADQAVINNKTFVAQTYTDTVGTGFSTAGAASVIADVDGTAASVSTALAKLANGALDGQVPGLGLVQALTTAEAAQVAHEDANKAAVDALAATLKVTSTDVFADDLVAVYGEAQTARGIFKDSTSVLTAKAGDAAKATATAYAALDGAGKAKADAYVAAVKADAALKGAADADVAAVKVGLAADDAFTPAVVAEAKKVDATIADAETLYAFYTKGTTSADQRTKLDAALKDVPYYSTFKATAVIDSAKNVAGEKVSTTFDDAAPAFTTAYGKQVVADKTLADAKAADVNVDAAKALVDAYAVKTGAVDAAEKAISDFNSTHPESSIKDIAASQAGSDTVKDVFYFADKATGGADYTFASKAFGAGDSIILDSSYAYNNGALSTGDNNKLEFFLVKSDAGVQVVLETANYGSSELTPNATTGAIPAAPADHNIVITLTGVTADHLAVNNGVISYV